MILEIFFIYMVIAIITVCLPKPRFAKGGLIASDLFYMPRCQGQYIPISLARAETSNFIAGEKIKAFSPIQIKDGKVFNSELQDFHKFAKPVKEIDKPRDFDSPPLGKE